ncbi:MAG: PD40 domain-containing protein, partial [Thermoguttaceae bacterium]|nr:PD40 domain-containing protein [Thermoguttaceae bacterium]
MRRPAAICCFRWASVFLFLASAGILRPERLAAEEPYRPGPMLQRFLDGPMAGLDEIVFAVRVPGRDHWYVTFGNYADHSEYPKNLGFKFEDGVYWGYGEGGRLCRYNLRTGELKVLLDDAKGGVRDPQLHYDGQKILFSYRKGGEHVFHLYEINIDGSGLKQLTDGPDDDIEPTYCPDGSIIFCSSRCRRFVNCWYTRVAALYRCDGDGKNVRMLSSNNDHDNTPWVLPDGRVLYMRWEYVDRSQVHYHHLWTMNPDGTGQMVYYGNLHGGIAMLDAKPIPGTKKVVASFSPGHGIPEHLGHVAIVDPSLGPDALEMARNVSADNWWKDPYPISAECFLVARKEGIFVMDGQGQHELVYRLPEAERERLQCHEPRPLAPRERERLIPDRIDPSRPTARLVLENIYAGRKTAALAPGSVKKLLVMKQLPKPVNFSGGMEPLTIGGSFTLAEILGTVPVEEDGSAFMELPALQSLFFVALDAENKPVKRMHSFAVL